ncbi:hypothetical protein BV25DRAFT_646506 [Artomyces pyxidatus]|uniref:Uncharacterized protein n=1 Tax=Artomyces pyxidatus TaxID=48021 RepID=A0ACB8T1I6_9AGAM|nr:hypothetical protein BV25DRAFT_646506 [Artomyces pyxidatus]
MGATDIALTVSGIFELRGLAHPIRIACSSVKLQLPGETGASYQVCSNPRPSQTQCGPVDGRGTRGHQRPTSTPGLGAAEHRQRSCSSLRNPARRSTPRSRDRRCDRAFARVYLDMRSISSNCSQILMLISSGVRPFLPNAMLGPSAQAPSGVRPRTVAIQIISRESHSCNPLEWSVRHNITALGEKEPRRSPIGAGPSRASGLLCETQRVCSAIRRRRCVRMHEHLQETTRPAGGNAHAYV